MGLEIALHVTLLGFHKRVKLTKSVYSLVTHFHVKQKKDMAEVRANNVLLSGFSGIGVPV